MKNFYNILKKEVKELLTRELILSIVFVCMMFVLIGRIASSARKEAKKRVNIGIVDLDGIPWLDDMINMLKKGNVRVALISEKDLERAILKARKERLTSLLVIPKGTLAKIDGMSGAEIELYSIVRGLSIEEVTSSEQIKGVLSVMNRFLSKKFLNEIVPDKEPENVLNPVNTKDFLVIRGKKILGSPAVIASLMTSQSVVIPLVLMIVIIYAGTMIMTSMGMEKENKTLETLLTLPISRTCIIAGKMAGASVVAVIMTIVYMIGFRYYMVGIAGNIETSVSLKSLGLVMTPGGYTVLGVSLFLAILSALSFCIILGVFVQDAKSAQTMSLPVSLLVMIPFVISMFKNIGDLPILPRIAIYLIPFSHPIIASRLLIFGDYPTIIGGMLYMIVFIAVMMWVASVLFRKDILLTARARFIRIRGKR